MRTPSRTLYAVPGGGSGGGFKGAWDSGTAYSAGDLVTLARSPAGAGLSSGASYGALTGSTNHAPVTSTRQAAPGTADAADAGTYEIGLKFSASKALRLTGIVWYKASTATGTHIAHLWNADTAALLVTAPIDTETSSGAQLCSFDYDTRPGVNYFATVSLPNGHYGVDATAFTAPVTLGSITFPANAGAFKGTVNTIPDTSSAQYYGVTPAWDEPDSNWTITGRY